MGLTSEQAYAAVANRRCKGCGGKGHTVQGCPEVTRERPKKRAGAMPEVRLEPEPVQAGDRFRVVEDFTCEDTGTFFAADVEYQAAGGETWLQLYPFQRIPPAKWTTTIPRVGFGIGLLEAPKTTGQGIAEAARRKGRIAKRVAASIRASAPLESAE